MGLRIGTNIGALTALRSLFQGGTRENQALERLSTGLAINRASDNPAGLVISDLLRSQLGGIDQALSNTQTATNLVQTADAGLGQIGDLLASARGLAVKAANTGSLGSEEQGALQDSLNATLDAVDRISATTRFGDQPLLNGARDFSLQNVSPQLLDVRVAGADVSTGLPQHVDVNVISAATQAQATGTVSPLQASASTVRLSGQLGTVTLNFAAGATQGEVDAAINANTGSTGVQSAAGVIQSQNVGSDAFVNFEVLSGGFSGIAAGRTQGTDVVATIDGQTAVGSGNVASINDGNLNATVTLQQGAAGAFGFDIAGGGSTFQLGPGSLAADRFSIGIPNVGASALGDVNLGSLDTLRTGGANSLSNNPGGAISVLDAAAGQIDTLRSQLGSAESKIFDSNRNALDVAFENLSASNSQIRDANFAQEITNSLRERFLRESTLSVLRSANLSQGSVLKLLGQ